MNIIQKPSLNKDNNRTRIDTIVIHWIVGNIAAADGAFSKPGGTSAHYAVEDAKIHQYVPENMVAYHAGNYSVNQRSIGIEHSAAPDRAASNQTYETSGQLIAEIAKRHGIPLDRAHIRGHKEIIPTQCPGTMNIDRLISIAKKYQGGGTAMANMYKGLDLSNPDSMKVAVDVWDDVVNKKLYVKKSEIPTQSDPKADNLKKALKEFLS